jgi:hypothetical protein
VKYFSPEDWTGESALNFLAKFVPARMDFSGIREPLTTVSTLAQLQLMLATERGQAIDLPNPLKSVTSCRLLGPARKSCARSQYCGS